MNGYGYSAGRLQAQMRLLYKCDFGCLERYIVGLDGSETIDAV